MTSSLFVDAMLPWYTCVGDKMNRRAVYGFGPTRKTSSEALDKIFRECVVLQQQGTEILVGKAKSVAGFRNEKYRSKAVPRVVAVFELSLREQADKQCQFGFCIERLEDGPIATLPDPDDNPTETNNAPNQ